jgi:hypothetical protein
MNPDHVVSDQAKEAYARGTQLLAGLSYQLAEVTGRGRIDHDTCMDLQRRVDRIWHWLYVGTLYATRDYDLPDELWDEADNTYSDGSPVRVRARFQPAEEDYTWPHNRHLLEGAPICEYPLGAVTVINAAPTRDERA